MNLVIVYGLATVDYSWLDQFYPAHRFSQACKNRGIPLRFLFPRDVPQFLETEKPNQTETIFLVRGNVALSTIQSIEKAGYGCVNSSQARTIADDKLETARFLSAFGWPSPKTISAASFRPGSLAFPLVAKPRFGSRGKGVELVETAEELDRLIKNERTESMQKQAASAHPESDSLPDEYILQEYISASHGRDLRVLFADGEVLAIVERHSDSGALVSNACSGGIMSLADANRAVASEAAALALKIARESLLWYGTADFLYLDENRTKVTVCELNASPGFEELEKQCGLDIAGKIVDALGARFG